MEFQRARSEEQRDQRRRQILTTAAEMLSEMSVQEMSLNELSRRIGLAKSNVLRYFETREAVLLDLLGSELQDWVAGLERSLKAPQGTARQRGDQLASEIASSLAARPLLCDLASAQAAVLERNVSTEVVLRHKRSIRESVEALAELVTRQLPELETEDAIQIISIALLMTSAAWPHSRPTEALLAAYEADPLLADLHLDFSEYIRGTLEVSISGLLARKNSCARRR